MEGSRVERQAKRSELGRRAEELAASYLTAQGFRVVDRNVRIGRDELDVVAERGGLLVVCEVRARTDDTWVTPAQTITKTKAASVRRGVAAYIRARQLRGMAVRIDVASVTVRAGELSLNYLEGAL